MRNDPLLIQFGALEMQKKEKDRYNDISYTLRCIAKLIVKFKSVSGKEDVFGKDLIVPENFENIVKAVKNLSDFKCPRKIAKPHRILKLGYSLRTLAEIATLKYIKENADTKVIEFQKFMYLYEGEYSIYANNARAVYRKRKAYIPEELPEEEDVKAVRSYWINEILRICRKVKKNGIGRDDYRQLSKTTLVRLITFNARRGGEPSKLKLADWEGVKDDRWKRRTDIEQLNDPVEKTLAGRLKLCYVKGKKKKDNSNSLMPILFTSETVEAIDSLVQYRSEVGIADTNQYLFARGEGENYLVGWYTLQAISKQIVLKRPKLITPTRTRKWLATMMQLLDMTDAELTWLTNHTGHSKNVHFAWYRKEDATIELTKVAKVLSAIDEGEDIANKKIDGLMCADNEKGCCIFLYLRICDLS